MMGDIHLEPFELELSRPLSTASGTITQRAGVLVRIETDERVGIGEATPLPGWTESLADCRSALERVADNWERETECTDIDALFGDCLESAPAARHGLTLACLDLRAKQARLPLYRYLGGRDRVESVPVNATIGDGSIEETVSRATVAVEQGYSCLKCKVGARPVAVDIARLRAVRSAVGPEIELRGDANAAWDRTQADRAFTALDGVVRYIEQPLPPDDTAGHAALRTTGSVGVALDESLIDTAVERVLAAGAADVLVLKPMVLGGIDRAHATARLVRAARTDTTAVVTTTIDGAYACVGGVHVGATLPALPACGLATAGLLADDLASGPSVAGGAIAVPQRPGVGIETGNSTECSERTNA